MKKVLIIANKTAKYDSIIDTFKDISTEVAVCSYHDLAFSLDGSKTTITIHPANIDLRTFSKILVLATSPQHLQNYIFSALACYCRKYQIDLIDNSFSNLDGKLYALWRFWEKDLPIAKTAFGPTDFLASKLVEFDSCGILKSTQGTKGKDSYLVRSKAELRQVIKNHPDVNFVLQNFIENNGDWRIILVNFEPKLAIFRSSHGKDFRNNTSVGGDANLVSLSEVNPKVLKLAVAAAKALDIKIAGADILPSLTGQLTVLEVNRTPQLVTGSFVDAKLKVLDELVHN